MSDERVPLSWAYVVEGAVVITATPTAHKKRLGRETEKFHRLPLRGGAAKKIVGQDEAVQAPTRNKEGGGT